MPAPGNSAGSAPGTAGQTPAGPANRPEQSPQRPAGWSGQAGPPDYWSGRPPNNPPGQPRPGGPTAGPGTPGGQNAGTGTPGGPTAGPGTPGGQSPGPGNADAPTSSLPALGGPVPAGPPPNGPPPGGSPADGGVPAGGPAGRPRRRTGLLVTLAAVLVLALALTGVAVVRPGPVAGWLGADPPPAAVDVDPSEPPPPPVLATVGANAPAPTPDGVRAALTPLITGSPLGNEVNISVLDAVTGEALFQNGQNTPSVPASTTKLVTAVTVLAARGPAYRIGTRVVAGPNSGEVVIIGAGDPTLAVNATGWYPGAGRLDRLAAQVKKALGGTVPTKVIVDSSLFPGPNVAPGWDSDAHTGGFGAVITALMTDGARIDPTDKGRGQARSGNPDRAAGRSFAKALGLPASAVTEGKAPAAPATTPSASPGTPTPGAELGKVESPPMIRLVEFMLRESDNVVAEALARQVALARNKPASFAGGSTAMNEVIAELGLPATESSLADGSGLSRNNRVTPNLLTDLLAMAAKGTRPELADLFPGLPVAAWSGTLDDRFDQAGERPTRAGAGVVRAKTGTLTGVHSISGVVTTAEGRLLVFAVIANKVPVGQDEAQPELDRIATALARCGCR